MLQRFKERQRRRELQRFLLSGDYTFPASVAEAAGLSDGRLRRAGFEFMIDSETWRPGPDRFWKRVMGQALKKSRFDYYIRPGIVNQFGDTVSAEEMEKAMARFVEDCKHRTVKYTPLRCAENVKCHIVLDDGREMPANVGRRLEFADGESAPPGKGADDK